MGLARLSEPDNAQGDLFGVPEPVRSIYVPKREHVLNRLVEMLAELRGARAWPWEETRIELYRNTVWPHLLRLLPDGEAEKWRVDLETEASRLDSA